MAASALSAACSQAVSSDFSHTPHPHHAHRRSVTHPHSALPQQNASVPLYLQLLRGCAGAACSSATRLQRPGRAASIALGPSNRRRACCCWRARQCWRECRAGSRRDERTRAVGRPYWCPAIARLGAWEAGNALKSSEPRHSSHDSSESEKRVCFAGELAICGLLRMSPPPYTDIHQAPGQCWLETVLRRTMAVGRRQARPGCRRDRPAARRRRC
jgi:hypothetical protein